MHSMPMHLIEAPLTLIAPPITPDILPISVYVVILPRSSVVTAISPNISTLAVFLPQLILPLILTPVRPGFDSLPTLKIVNPISFVNRTISMIVYPKSMSLTIHPLPLEAIFIRVGEFPLAELVVGPPLPIVLTPIGICLQSPPLSLPTDPFPVIGTARSEGHNGQFLLVIFLHLCLYEFKQRIFLLFLRRSLYCSPRQAISYLQKNGCIQASGRVWLPLSRSLGFSATRLSQKFWQLLSLPIQDYNPTRCEIFSQKMPCHFLDPIASVILYRVGNQEVAQDAQYKYQSQLQMFSHSPLEDLHELRSLPLEDREKGLPMIRVYHTPFFPGTLETRGLMLEVASIPIAAVSFLGECVTSLRLVGTIVFHVNPQLLGAMGELAFIPIGAEAFLGIVLAEGTLGFGGSAPVEGSHMLRESIMVKLSILALG